MSKDRIERVQDFILHNLDEDLSLTKLSEIANLSKYHFHRLFVVNTGITLFRFIQLARFKKAAYQLAFNDDKRIIDIALDAGFESPEAFTRAFKKKNLDMTPSQFRKQPDWSIWHKQLELRLQKKGEDEMEVKIVVFFPETKIALLEHRGSPERVLETAGIFIKWRKETGLSPVKTSKTFGIAYDDPQSTKAEDFRFDICGSISKDIPENAYGVKTGLIPSGRCAVVRHEGSLDNVSEKIFALYGDWLPNSGEELRDFPCFFHYINLIPDVDECDLLTDIYLPIK